MRQKERCYMTLSPRRCAWPFEAQQNPRRPCCRCSVANPIGQCFFSWMTDDVQLVSLCWMIQRELGRYGRRSAGSPAARQRNVTSILSVSIFLFSLSSKLLLLFRTRSCLESRAHCWFAAERARPLRMQHRRAACGPIPSRYRHQSATAALPAHRCSPPQRQRR
jgi:hypothetical protein